MVRSLFLFLFALTTGTSGVSAKTCEDGKFIKFFALAVLAIAAKVTERSSAMKIFHELDILDLDTDDV